MENGPTYICNTTTAQATKQLAAALAPYLHKGDVIVLEGDLGAGKTQFAQGLAEGLGIRGAVTSPSFNILLQYGDGRIPLYHFDLYRLESGDELEDIAYFETLEGEGVSLVEWGSKFPEALPCDYLEVRITPKENSEGEEIRQIRVHSFGVRSRDLLQAWAADSKAGLMKVAE